MSGLARSGYERRACGRKGDGVFALREFSVGELVMSGTIELISTKNDSHAVEVSPGEFVREGGLSAIVNHSCEPNCGVRRNPHGALDLIARRAISTDEEITVDYAMHSYVIEHFPAQCLCGSERCRGRITGWRDLPEASRKAYAGYVAPSLSAREDRSPTLERAA